jgi:23S rRNA (adenine2503-C2)-methyltransferase
MEAQLTTEKTNLFGMSIPELEDFVVSIGLERFRAKQIYKWLYSKNTRDFDEITDLSKKAREVLKEKAVLGGLSLITREISNDGTQKFLFATPEGDKVESVLMFFDDRDSHSACISSQVGCAVGCPFCATGTLGFQKNLTAAQIAEQVQFMQSLSGERIDNIVYMGQGEPLNNYDNVVNSIDILRNDIGIGVRHITISTSGVIHRIEQLGDLGLQITLALSLHDPTDEDRDFLVPINKKWPVFEVIESLKEYYKKTNRRVTIEYVMLKDRNDSDEKAALLGHLIKDLHCNINLIPYNTTDVNDPFQRSTNSRIKDFKNVLMKTSFNKTVTIRKERGHDINAACGQLANKHSE